MDRITQISLDTSAHFIFLIILCIAAASLSYFIYRRTVPPVSTRLRITLMILRSLALILVILTLFQPILRITRDKEEKPVVAVLLDTSASMSLTDQSADRELEVRKILAERPFADSPDDYTMTFYPFSSALKEKIVPGIDSLSFDGDGTDIEKSLAELKEELSSAYLASVVLITDGANNIGVNPARFVANYGVPVHTIAIGDARPQKDILITNFVTNEVAYAGNEIPVDVFIKNFGFDGQKITLTLASGKSTEDARTLTLAGDGLEQKIRLMFNPEKEGLVKYQLKLPGLDGEVTHANNAKTFYVKVLKSKLEVLVVAGSASPDFKFWKRALDASANVQATFAVEKNNGTFYPAFKFPADTASFDCLILLDYPRKKSAATILEKIKSRLAKGSPLLVLMSGQTNEDNLWKLQDYLPIAKKTVQGREKLVYMALSPGGLHHPILRLSENDLENRTKWRELPPVFTRVRTVALHAKGQTLAVVNPEKTSKTAAERSVPLIAVSTAGKRKSVVILAYHLWRWDLLMQGAGKGNASYTRFQQNILRWLTTGDDSKLVRITSNKEVYRSGEDVKFSAQVYFEDLQPADAAEVTIQVKQNESLHDLTLESLGGGRYEGRFPVLEGGDYTFIGTAQFQGRALGHDTGKFTVEPFSLEFQNTRMNEELLRKIASESGGRYFTVQNFDSLAQQLDFPQKFITLKNEWEIWNRIPMLIACIVLLSAEWFIRKRKGML